MLRQESYAVRVHQEQRRDNGAYDPMVADDGETTELLRRKLAEQRNMPPLEVARTFLRTSVSDADSLAEIREDAARAVAVNPRPIRTALEALDMLIADPPVDGTLAWLVEVDANWVLEDPSDSGAVEFLHQLANTLREIVR